MSKHLPVLIIGAGPTGLMMACELARHNIPFRIIDKKSARAEGSNATWLQTRTLEIFDAVGIAEGFLKVGHHCDAINFYIKGKQVVKIGLNKIDSIYPFILMLPQSETERLLNEKLQASKIQVERSVELMDIKQTEDGVISTVRLADGNPENITSDWVIACDGANSTVRSKLQIAFSGKDLPEQFMVADAQMSSSLPKNEINVFFDEGTIFLRKRHCFQLFPGDQINIVLALIFIRDMQGRVFTELEVREIVAERTYGNYIVDNVSWISPFWIHSKIVDSMRQGQIFLAGDAADIHSPAGGQGMNTGIQDAYNLAWKLALVIKEKANLSLLDSYQLERYPVVNDIVNQTEFFTNMMLFDKEFFSKLQNSSQSIASDPSLAKKIGEQLTQVSIQYKDSPVINYHDKLASPSLQPGERAPNVNILDVKTNKPKKLYDYVRSTFHNVLLFTGEAPNKEDLDKINELQRSLQKSFPDLVRVNIVTREKLEDIENIIPDSDGVVHKRYNVKGPAIYVIRPDNYISYCSNKLSFDSLEQLFRTFIK